LKEFIKIRMTPPPTLIHISKQIPKIKFSFKLPNSMDKAVEM
jgi:hypothetical protein